MDLSKLPKMSETPRPPEEPPEREKSTLDYRRDPMQIGAEAWISLAIGVIILLMQQRFLAWVVGHDTGWTFTDKDGQPLTYPRTLFFINDMGLAVFGLALVIDGITLFLAKPWTVLIGLIVTLAATLLNLFTVAKLMSELGVQIFPALAVAIGVYTALYQWKALRMLRGGRPAPMT